MGAMVPTSRRSYHHGDLAEALVAQALSVTAQWGPDALSLRDLATRLGVSPTATYRHYPSLDHLRAEVSQRAREQLARTLELARDSAPRTRTSAQRARKRLRSVGEAYVRFAFEQPRLFETAFRPCPVSPPRPDEPDAWQVLNDLLDDLVASGAMPAKRRADAPWIAWSAVHGLASVLVRTALPEPLALGQAMTAVLDGVDRALTVS